MSPLKSKNTFNLGLALVSLGLLIYIASVVVSGLHIRKTTGTLTITTFAANTAISIGQNNKTALQIGTGTAKLRVQAGSYEVVASSNGRTASGQVTVQPQKNTAIHIAYSGGSPVPSPDNISFNGMQALIAQGITTTQASNLRNLFFKYKQSAKTIQIDADSITFGYRDPDSDTPFTLNFTGAIDGQKYKATITYTDLDNLELTIFDPQTGTQLYDANSLQAQG